MSGPAVVQHASTVIRVAGRMDAGSRGLVSECIANSWRRCINEYSLDPALAHLPEVIGGDDLKDRQAQHDELVQVASAEIDALYDQISGSGYALLLTDASGIILCSKLDPILDKSFRAAGLVIGADWSERCEGTNGMGTCIVENRGLTVHRAEHFRAHHIGLSCSAAPIHDPAGTLVAVLDASSVAAHDTRTSQAHTMALVNLSAHLIEKCVFLTRYRNGTVLRFHARPELVNLLHDGGLALADDGTVIAADETAVRLLGASTRVDLVGRSICEILDAPVEELMALGSSPHRALWPVRDAMLGRRFFVSLHDGKMLAQACNAALPVRESRTVVQFPAASTRTLDMTLEELAGDDPQMIRTVRSARRVADSQVSVMIQGATGTGKDCFAHALHSISRRAQQPFVAVNCAAIPESLVESELFGYRPGAFTGASREGMRGKVLQSSGGTLFLDEIGDMQLALQTRLLRVLEEQEIVPLGAEKPIKVDLRVVSASHRNLREMIARGEFREDLYYRLNGITLELPDLAARSDKERLIRQFLAAETSDGRPAAIEMDAFQRLLAHDWPGNIRELRNVIRSALAICDGGVVRLVDLPRELRENPPNPPALAQRVANPSQPPQMPASTLDGSPRSRNPLEVAEREALVAAIEANRGNMRNTARQLGVSRNTLYRKLKRHRIAVGAARRDIGS